MDPSGKTGAFSSAAMRIGWHCPFELLPRVERAVGQAERSCDETDRSALPEMASVWFPPYDPGIIALLQPAHQREAGSASNAGDGVEIHSAPAPSQSGMARAPALPLLAQRPVNRGSRTSLVCRHHVYPDAPRSSLYGGGYGLVQPIRAGLGTVQHDGFRILPKCPEWGALARDAGDLQHRPGGSVHQCGFRRQVTCRRRQDQHGWTRPCLGQRVHRAALVESEVRGSVSRRLRQRMGGAPAHQSLCAVLQHRTSTSGIELPDTARCSLRTSASRSAGYLLMTAALPQPVLPPPLQSSDELLGPILGSQGERQNSTNTYVMTTQQPQERRMDTQNSISYFTVLPVQWMGGSPGF